LGHTRNEQKKKGLPQTIRELVALHPSEGREIRTSTKHQTDSLQEEDHGRKNYPPSERKEYPTQGQGSISIACARHQEESHTVHDNILKNITFITPTL
jgi:hypothetical protein